MARLAGISHKHNGKTTHSPLSSGSAHHHPHSQHSKQAQLDSAGQELEKKELRMVQSNFLTVGSALAAILFVLLLNSVLSPDSRQARQPGLTSLPDSVLPSINEVMAPYSMAEPLDVETGLYSCNPKDIADCQTYCGQVRLRMQACSVRVAGRTLNSALCTCITE